MGPSPQALSWRGRRAWSRAPASEGFPASLRIATSRPPWARGAMGAESLERSQCHAQARGLRSTFSAWDNVARALGTRRSQTRDAPLADDAASVELLGAAFGSPPNRVPI